jgi:hypothetical protein
MEAREQRCDDEDWYGRELLPDDRFVACTYRAWT